MKKPLIISILVILTAILSFSFWRNNDRRDGVQSFAHTGTVEAVEVAVSFQIPGNVTMVLFDEGETIREGQLLASLDTVSLAEEVKRAQAAHAAAVSRLDTARARERFLQKAVQAQISGAEANLGKLTSGLRPQEVEAARLNVEKAQAEADRARDEAARTKRLFDDEVVPLVRWERAETAAQVAMATLLGAREALTMAQLGTRDEDVQGARALLQAARARLEEVQAARLEARTIEDEIRLREAELKLASTRLGHAALTAPLSGVALTRSIEPGENVLAARPVSTIADLSEVKVRFYVPEKELGGLRLAGRVHFLSDSYPGRQFEGRISYISEQAEFTPKSILTKEERTRLVYMVRAVAPNPDRNLKPGMPVDVILDR